MNIQYIKSNQSRIFPAKKMLLLLTSLATQSIWSSGMVAPSYAIDAANTANANAAEAKNPSTLAANSAGLTHLPGTYFENNFLLILPDFYYSEAKGYYFKSHVPIKGQTSGQVGHRIEAPSLFISHQLTPSLFAGLGIYGGFGADFDYPMNSVTRFNTNRVRILSVSFNPNIAIKLNDHHSIGLGVYALWSRGTLRQFADAAYGVNSFANLFLPFLNGKYLVPDGSFEIYTTLRGTGVAYGYNLAWLWDVNDKVRLGLSYRSKSKAPFKGEAWWQAYSYGWDIPILGAIIDDIYHRLGYVHHETVNFELKYPENWQLHAFWQVSDQLDLMANLAFFKDSRQKVLHIDWAHTKLVPDAQKRIPTLVPRRYTDVAIDFKDTWQASIGANYRYNDRINLRGGIMYTPSSAKDNQGRAPAIPDNDRFMVGVGGDYHYNKHLTFNVSYNFLKQKTSKIDNGSFCGKRQEYGAGALSCVDSRASTQADVKVKAHIVGVGVQYQF